MKKSSRLTRRTPLRTVKPLARKTRLSRVRKATRHWRREAAAGRGEYLECHARCAVCCLSAFARPSRPMQVHHICGRGSRKFEVPGNWIVLCARDHRHYHFGGEHADDGQPLPELTPGMILWAKRAADPEQYDPALLAGLRGWKALPEDWMPRELPEAFLRERERN